MEPVADRVKKIIVDQLGVEEELVTPEASFVDDLGADSLDTVELVMALEEEFGLEIPDEDAEKITRVKEAIDYIEKHGDKAKKQGVMAARRRVVVTGVGLVSPLGVGTAPTWASLVEGRSGMAPITLFDASLHSTAFAAEVKGFDPPEWIDKKDVKKM